MTLESLLGRQRGTGQPVPLGAALEILAEVTQALSRVHTAPGPDGRPRRAAHGDVRAATVLLSPAGAVSLSPPRTGGPQDPSVDLTSLGRLMHELVTLTPEVLPGGAGGRMLALDQIEAAEKRIRRASLELALVFRRCVHETAEDRYLDAASLLRDLQRMRGKLPQSAPMASWLAGLMRQAPPPSPPTRAAVSPRAVASPSPAPSSNVPDLFAGSSTAPALAPAPIPRERPEPARRTPAPPSKGKRQVWQRRAARNAALARLGGAVVLGLAALYGATFLGGPIGEQARAVWEPLAAWVAGLRP